MQLSDQCILKAYEDKELQISNFDYNRLQTASYDVLLGNDFIVFNSHTSSIIDPKNPIAETTSKIRIEDEGFFVLQPQKLALGVTLDRIGVSANYACQINGKSSLARLGLIIHTTAGFIDPGNNLNITLELYNTNSMPIKLYPGMKIAQVTFWKLSTNAKRPYGSVGLNSKYYNSTSVENSKMNENWLMI